MSTPPSEVKTVTTEVATLSSRIAALEAQAKAWYASHLLYIGLGVGTLVGFVAGHYLH